MTSLSSTRTPHQTSTWHIDPAHSHVEFAVRHMMIATVKGRFAGVRGTLELDDQDPARSRVEVEIDAATIDTRNDDRDNHLRSADFLDVESHPALTFRSRRVESVAEASRLRLVGDLTIRGITREVALDVDVLGRTISPFGGEVTGYSASTTIDRRDFGLKWNQAMETGGVLVANEVRIQLEVEAVRPSEA